MDMWKPWLNTDRPPENTRVYWVGAGTRDTGFSLTRLTFQVTHATDSDTNAERDYIVAPAAFGPGAGVGWRSLRGAMQFLTLAGSRA